MKFSYRQILASAVGAVLSAIVASIFGVKGTIVGVAIGSIAATTGTALVFPATHVHNPMHFVLHAPVPPHRARKELHVQQPQRYLRGIEMHLAKTVYVSQTVEFQVFLA